MKGNDYMRQTKLQCLNRNGQLSCSSLSFFITRWLLECLLPQLSYVVSKSSSMSQERHDWSSVLTHPSAWSLTSFFFFFLILGSGPFQKSLFNLLKYCFCFMFCFWGHEAFGILAPQPGVEPALPALELEVLTTGPPQKFPLLLIYRNL